MFKTKVISLIILTAFAGSANATVVPAGSNTNMVTGISISETSSQQQQNATVNNGGNSQAVTVAAPGSYRPAVDSAYAPTIFPTAPCMGSSSMGVSGSLIGLSLGSSWTSEECLILETARGFDQAGYVEDGLNVRCQAKYAKVAPSCKALLHKEETK